MSRYHDVERRCDAVVVVGTDYTDVAGPTELAYNARIAANLGAPVVLVVNGSDRTPAVVAQVADVVVDGDAGQPRAGRRRRRQPVRARARSTASATPCGTAPGCRRGRCPENPLLTAPTVRQLSEAVRGTLIAGDEALLSREVLDVIVGAMSVEHLLGRLTDGSVVITPGDRSDVLLGLLMAHQAEGFPSLAGIILNGGFRPAPLITRLVDGPRQPAADPVAPSSAPSGPRAPSATRTGASPPTRSARSTRRCRCSSSTSTARPCWPRSTWSGPRWSPR